MLKIKNPLSWTIYMQNKLKNSDQTMDLEHFQRSKEHLQTTPIIE